MSPKILLRLYIYNRQSAQDAKKYQGVVAMWVLLVLAGMQVYRTDIQTAKTLASVKTMEFSAAIKSIPQSRTTRKGEFCLSLRGVV